LEQKSIIRFRISGVCGILTPILAFMFISLSINSAPEFSWMENALSDLGVMLGVTSVLFNYGLIISGILGFIFATSLFRVLRFEINRGLGGALLFSLACLALIAIGVFPENVRYVHYFASVAFFVLLMGSLLRMGLAFWFMRKKPMAVFTLVLAVIAVVPWLLLFLVRYVSGVAIPELISAVAGGVWLQDAEDGVAIKRSIVAFIV
jgi:hypothetical membrane protein